MTTCTGRTEYEKSFTAYDFMEKLPLFIGRRAGLVVRASDSGARGRGFDPHSGALAWWLGRRIPEQEVGGSILTRVTVLCP